MQKLYFQIFFKGFPGGTSSKEFACQWASLMALMVKNPPAMWVTWSQSLGWEDPLEKGIPTHSSILAWKNSMGIGAWWAIVHGVAKSQTRLSNQTHTKTNQKRHYIQFCSHSIRYYFHNVFNFNVFLSNLIKRTNIFCTQYTYVKFGGFEIQIQYINKCLNIQCR